MPNYVTLYDKTNSYYKHGLWVDGKDVPITGLRRTRYPSTDELQDETNIVNGVLEGVQKVYDASGTLWYENTWKNNMLISFKKF